MNSLGLVHPCYACQCKILPLHNCVCVSIPSAGKVLPFHGECFTNFFGEFANASLPGDDIGCCVCGNPYEDGFIIFSYMLDRGHTNFFVDYCKDCFEMASGSELLDGTDFLEGTK